MNYFKDMQNINDLFQYIGVIWIVVNI